MQVRCGPAFAFVADFANLWPAHRGSSGGITAFPRYTHLRSWPELPARHGDCDLRVVTDSLEFCDNDAQRHVLYLYLLRLFPFWSLSLSRSLSSALLQKCQESRCPSALLATDRIAWAWLVQTFEAQNTTITQQHDMTPPAAQQAGSRVILVSMEIRRHDPGLAWLSGFASQSREQPVFIILVDSSPLVRSLQRRRQLGQVGQPGRWVAFRKRSYEIVNQDMSRG
jgi:hypothetical protein